MELLLRESKPADLPFLRKMLYEAVFWRGGDNKPVLEEGLSLPDPARSLADWGKRDGDTAVVALVDSTPVGAAWYRYWNDTNNILGYIEENTPVLVIGVHSDYRHQGIGTKMVEWLVDCASKQAIQRLSLNVSKDNYAKHLYLQQGFQVFVDKGDALTMTRKI